MLTAIPVNVVALVKGDERYLFLYDCHPDSVRVCREKLGEFAANPELSFTWRDGGILSKKMRAMEARETFYGPILG